MNVTQKFACVAISLGLAMAGSVADYAWKGGSGTWSDPTKWQPEGVPGATHTVEVTDGDIALTEAVSVTGLSLGGTVTFSGEALTITGPAGTSFMSTGDTDVLTFSNKLNFTSAQVQTLNMPGTWYFCGGLYYNSYFRPTGGAMYIRETPIDVQRFEPGMDVYIEVSNNNLGRLQISTHEVHVNVDNPWTQKGCANFSFDYLYMYANGGKLYLNGHDVHLPRIILANNVTAEISTDSPATMSFDNTVEDTRYGDKATISGSLSLKLSSKSKPETPFVTETKIASTGGLIVEGGVFKFGSSSSWDNISYMRINGGKVHVPAGKTITVPALYLGDSETSEAENTYTASDLPAYLEGEGAVLVHFRAGPATALTWSGGDPSSYSLASGANWVGAPETVPYSDGGLAVTFAQSGSRAEIDGFNAWLRGVTFDAPGDFELASVGVGTLTLGENGIVTATPGSGTRTYTISSPTSFRSSQNLAVADGTSLLMTKSISIQPAAIVEKTGAGRLDIGADGIVDGDLTVSAGRMDLAAGVDLLADRASASLRTLTRSDGASVVLNGNTIAMNLEAGGCATAPGSDDAPGISVKGENVLLGSLHIGSTATTIHRLSMTENSVLTIKGGMKAGGYFAPATRGVSTVVGQGRIVIEDKPIGNLQLSIGNVELELHVADNMCSRYEVGGGIIHTYAPFAMNSSVAYLSLAYARSRMNLHGNDQRVGPMSLVSTYEDCYITSGTDAEGPATLYFDQNLESFDGRTITRTDLKGDLSLVKGGQYAFNVDMAVSTKGSLTVTNGTFGILSNGSWLNGTQFTVSGVSDTCKGVLSLAHSGALSKSANVTVEGKGKLDLAEGAVVRCAKLTIDGVRCAGTWGATGSGAQNIDDLHFSGKGVIRAPGGLVLMVR